MVPMGEVNPILTWMRMFTDIIRNRLNVGKSVDPPFC
jgi:hypothetical protein